jgi:hypothetical protein
VIPISIGRLVAFAGCCALSALQACSNHDSSRREKIAVSASAGDSPYGIEVKLFALPEGFRHLNHFSYSLKMGRDGFLYLGVGDNVSNGSLFRFHPVTEQLTHLGDFRSALPPSIRDRGNHGKFHVAPHQAVDGSVYFASHAREYWKGEQAGRLFRYTDRDGIVDLGPTPDNMGIYYMHGDDEQNKLYMATRASHFAVYDIASRTWKDKGRFSSKPPFIGLTDESGRLYVFSYDGKGDFVPGPATITRYDPRSDSLETSKKAPPTLWVGAVTPDHVTAYTTSYLDGDLFSWRFSDWPSFRVTQHGRIDPRGRPVDSNNMSVTPDTALLVVAGTIESKHNWHLGHVHGVWIYEIKSGRRYLAAKLNDALTESFGTRAGRLRIYWTNAGTRDSDGWIYMGIHTLAGAKSEGRLLALRVHARDRQ